MSRDTKAIRLRVIYWIFLWKSYGVFVEAYSAECSSRLVCRGGESRGIDLGIRGDEEEWRSQFSGLLHVWDLKITGIDQHHDGFSLKVKHWTWYEPKAFTFAWVLLGQSCLRILVQEIWDWEFWEETKPPDNTQRDWPKVPHWKVPKIREKFGRLSLLLGFDSATSWDWTLSTEV